MLNIFAEALLIATRFGHRVPPRHHETRGFESGYGHRTAELLRNRAS